jgi:flagellin
VAYIKIGKYWLYARYLMSIGINDVSSTILQKSFELSSSEATKSIIKLSAGKQTTAIEDAAKLMISEGLESQKRGSMEASENVQEGMNMLSMADSGLSSISDNLQQIKELHLKKQNGTMNDEDKSAIDDQIGALTSEIDRVSKTTSFNKKNLLDGSNSDLTLQIGANSGDKDNTANVGSSLGDASSKALNLDASSPDFSKNLDKALDSVTQRRSQIGALSNTLESTVNSLFTKTENLAASQSTLTDTDVATEASHLTQNQILQKSSLSLMAQANQTPAIAAILV